MANSLSQLIFPTTEFAAPSSSAPGDTVVTGVANTLARSDHKHAREAALVAATTVGSGTSFGTGTSVGTSINYAREDHNHGTPSLSSTTPTADAFGGGGAVGTGTTAARADHAHAQPAAPVTTLAVTNNASVSASTGAVTITNSLTPTYTSLSISGMTGATSASRHVGATTTGAPVSGTFITGDFVVAQNAHIWICTAGGTPGTWADAGSAGAVTSVAGRTGVVTLTAADIGAGTFPGANSYSGLQTFSAGLTMPSGQAITQGTSTSFTAVRSTTTNASDTVDLGVFSSTGGAMELRIHAHLISSAVSITKIYELAVGATMGTVSTWYLALPVDASANAAATNDFALEVNRTGSGTFSLRFRQKSIAAAGAITFKVETLGDTVVTFTSSSTITAAPAAVSTVHPSNAFVASAGNIGIGTETPAVLLDVNGAANFASNPSQLRLGPSGGTLPSALTSTSGAGSFVFGAQYDGSAWKNVGTAGGTAITLAAAATVFYTLAAGVDGATSVFTAAFQVGATDVTVNNGNVLAKSSTANTGYALLSNGNTTNAGAVWFYGAGATPVRHGYIGNGSGNPSTTDQGTISYVSSTHSFTSTTGAISTITLNADATGGRGPELAFFDTKSGQTTPNKYIRSNAGVLQFLNSAYTTAIASLNDTGGFTIVGDQTISKTIPQLLMPDGTRTGLVAVATAAGNAATGSAAGDLVLGVGTSPTYNGRVYFPGSIGIVGSITGLADFYIAGASLLLGDDASPVATTSAQSSVYSASGRPVAKDGVGNVWSLDSCIISRIASDQTTSVTTLANVPGLSQALAIGTYFYEVRGTWTSSSASIGVLWAVTFSGTQTAIELNSLTFTAGALAAGVSTAVATKTPTTSTLGTIAAEPFILSGTVTVTVSGTLQIQYASNSGPNNINVKAGTVMRVTRIA